MVSALGALLLAAGMVGGGYMIYLAAKNFQPLPVVGARGARRTNQFGEVGCPSCTTKLAYGYYYY